MNPLKKLFKQTAIYGLATVLPRMMNFLLLPLYTGILITAGYGRISVIFSFIAIFNVFLAYGMETAFFRFYNKADSKEAVISTSLISILSTTVVFAVVAFTFQDAMSNSSGVDIRFVRYATGILVLDALVIIPFAWLRANEKPMKYAVIKITNVAINLGLNLFFLIVLPKLFQDNSGSFLSGFYTPNFEISYIFLSNLIASGITLLMLLPLYFKSTYTFDIDLWKSMMKYAWPVLIAGIAFTINEVFDKLLLDKLLPAEIAKSEIGKYTACYKLGMFMTLFATAFRMGIEPFFFSHSEKENPQNAYAQITNYFVIIGSLILLTIVVFADTLKLLFVRGDEAYWEAMPIVPIILLAGFFLGIYHNLSVWYKVTDKTRYGALISVVGAIITIVINLLFIPVIGYMASAIATLMAYGSMMVLSYYLGKSHYPVPYNFRKILFYLGISILFSAVSFYGFNRNLYAGIPLLLIFLGMVYKLEHATLRKIFFKGQMEG